MKRSRILCLGLLPLCLVAACSQDALRAQRGDVLCDLTPELDTNRERWADRSNQVHMTIDTNLRSLNSDLGRALLLDRSSRLTPEPVR